MDAALVDVAFHTFHTPDISAAVGAVINHEYNNGVFGDIKLVEFSEKLTHVVVDVGYHCEYSGPLVGIVVVMEFVALVLREVPVAQVHRFILFVEVFGDIVKRAVGGVCRDVGNEVLRLSGAL